MLGARAACSTAEGLRGLRGLKRLLAVPPPLSVTPFFHVCCLGDKTDGSSFIALMAWLWCLAVDALVYSRGNKPRITPGALQSPSLHGISPEEEPIRPGFSQFCCALNTASVFKYYGAFLCSIYLMHAHAETITKTNSVSKDISR